MSDTPVDNYLLETYLSQVKDLNKRVAVTKLRLSAHNLPVEIGRYSNRYLNRHSYNAAEKK